MAYLVKKGPNVLGDVHLADTSFRALVGFAIVSR